jgi:hypothetical protein
MIGIMGNYDLYGNTDFFWNLHILFGTSLLDNGYLRCCYEMYESSHLQRLLAHLKIESFLPQNSDRTSPITRTFRVIEVFSEIKMGY